MGTSFGIIQGFHCNLGACNAIWAELWGPYIGVKLAGSHGVKKVIFELDSQVVVQFIHLRCCSNVFQRPLLQEILLSLLDLPDWHTQVSHIYRGASGPACQSWPLWNTFECTFVTDAPPALGPILLEVASGCSLPRVAL